MNTKAVVAIVLVSLFAVGYGVAGSKSAAAAGAVKSRTVALEATIEAAK